MLCMLNLFASALFLSHIAIKKKVIVHFEKKI